MGKYILFFLAIIIAGCAVNDKKPEFKGCGFEGSSTAISSSTSEKLSRSDGFTSDTLLQTLTLQEPIKEITIPVIFHVIYQNNNQNIGIDMIQQELQDLQLDFRKKNSDVSAIYSSYRQMASDAKVNFILADTIFAGSPDKGVKRVKRTAGGDLYLSDPVIQPDKYMNVYTGAIGSDGFTYTRPWRYPVSDAIFLYYEWVGGRYRLLTHETGHWLGLYHIFDGDCGSINDGINDTPPQAGQTGLGRGCDSVRPRNRCRNGALPMYNNFMDYSDCRSMFTQGQVDAIHANIQKHRSGLLR